MTGTPITGYTGIPVISGELSQDLQNGKRVDLPRIADVSEGGRQQRHVRNPLFFKDQRK